MKMKKDILFLFFILAGAIFGALLADFATKIPGIGWLAFGRSIGLWADKPAVLDLLIIKLTFGFEMTVNVAQILTILASVFVYEKVGKKI